MFDSTVLKGMKLPELQEIAKLAKTIKFAGVKKEKLIEMILDHQAATMAHDAPPAPASKEEKVKRARIKADSKIKPEASQDLFSEEKQVTVVEAPEEKPTEEKPFKNPKFKKKENILPL